VKGLHYRTRIYSLRSGDFFAKSEVAGDSLTIYGKSTRQKYILESGRSSVQPFLGKTADVALGKSNT
jgi:hypothetical protein